MSTEKKLSDILREELTRLDLEHKKLKEQFSLMEKQLLTTSDKADMDVTTTEKGHKNLKELVDCPNCYPEVKRLISPKILKEYGESLRGHKRVTCKECGLTVREEDAACPGCGGTKAE